MSMTREDYIIFGFDLSPYRDQIYTEEWRTDENIDKWECYQSKGNIQLFTDPMSGLHLYFGYILLSQNEYDIPETIKINLVDNGEEEVNEKYDMVLEALIESNLIQQSMQETIENDKVPFEIICFTEYR